MSHSRTQTEIAYVFLVSVRLIINLLVRIVCDGQFKLWNSSLCSFPPSVITSRLVGANIFTKHHLLYFERQTYKLKHSILFSSRCLTLRILMSYIYIYIYMEHLFLMFLNHKQRRTTVGRTPLDEWSDRRRDVEIQNTQILYILTDFKPFYLNLNILYLQTVLMFYVILVYPSKNTSLKMATICVRNM